MIGPEPFTADLHIHTHIHTHLPPGVGLPYMSTTLQISPGIRTNRPVAGKDPKGE